MKRYVRNFNERPVISMAMFYILGFSVMILYKALGIETILGSWSVLFFLGYYAAGMITSNLLYKYAWKENVDYLEALAARMVFWLLGYIAYLIAGSLSLIPAIAAALLIYFVAGWLFLRLLKY